MGCASGKMQNEIADKPKNNSASSIKLVMETKPVMTNNGTNIVHTTNEPDQHDGESASSHPDHLEDHPISSVDSSRNERIPMVEVSPDVATGNIMKQEPPANTSKNMDHNPLPSLAINDLTSAQESSDVTNTVSKDESKEKTEIEKLDDEISKRFGDTLRLSQLKMAHWRKIDVNTVKENAASANWWDIVDHLMTTTTPEVKPLLKRKNWKTVRLFVSSTFKDMHFEREHLVKRVFPDLRLWCEERRIRLIECDLRWGVPKDADTREILLSCLSELDRCFDENEHPYFLNLLSERYGWVPTPEEMPEDVKSRYKWLEGMSVTALEIFTGAYWDRNPHALYMLRNPSIVHEARLNETLKNYTESEQSNIESLDILKNKLQEHYPSQVFQYDANIDKEENGKLTLSGLDKFGDTVLTHFKKAIEHQYPATSIGERLSQSENIRADHESFMAQRSQILVGRDDIMDQISAYINTTTTEAQPLVLVGYPGAGKSALIASAAKQSVSDPKCKVFYHFVGATPGSTDLYQILTRLWQEIMPPLNHIPEDLDTMMRSTHTLISSAAEYATQSGYERLVIYMDALNQMDDEGEAHRLAWLPRKLPGNVRLVVSTLEGRTLDALREEPRLEVVVKPLGPQIRKNIVESILQEYNKQLDDEQLGILVKKEDAGRPLWLTIACEELRVFGEFRLLTDKVRQLPEDLTGLLQMVIARIITEYGGDLVLATLCIIETSRFGLLETEILELLAMHPRLPGDTYDQASDIGDRIPMAEWALVYLGLRQFLRPCGSSGDGRLDFYHRTISKVIKKVYLSKESDRQWWHRRLADYFENCSNIERKAEELPYHLETIDDKDRLKRALVDRPMFDELYCESSKQQLMRYWHFIGGYDEAAKEYMASLRQHIQEHNIQDVSVIEKLQAQVAWFLVDIGQYDAAEKLLTKMLQKIEERHGQEHELLANSLYAIVTLLYKKGIQYVYGNNPGYLECRKRGAHYASQCIKVHMKQCSVDDPHLGHVLTRCGYFISSALDDAKMIFERTGDMQGMAQVLYMLGERSQYDDDMNVPIGLFKESMELCKAHFGKLHLHTARCCQLYGQLYWNTYASRRKGADFCLGTCLELYKQELEVLEEVLGTVHPTTVRSREDVIIILETMGGRNKAEADEFRKRQPTDHEAM